jgi:hypothetical protein
MLFGETNAVYCENRMEHTDSLYSAGRMQFWYVKAGGTYNNRWAWKG